MKLEHLIQAYKVNSIEAEVEEMNSETEKAGVIKFSKEINAALKASDSFQKDFCFFLAK